MWEVFVYKWQTKLAEFYYDLFEVRELISETAGKLHSYKKLLLSPIM